MSKLSMFALSMIAYCKFFGHFINERLLLGRQITKSFLVKLSKRNMTELDPATKSRLKLIKM